MKTNIGPYDSVIRTWIALFIAVLIAAGMLNGLAMWIGLTAIVAMVGTALAGYCPLYTIFGICTLHEEKHLGY